VTGPLPGSAKGALQQLAGPRYRPAAYPLLQLAKDAIHGHAMIAEKVKEHAQKVAQERADARPADGAEGDAKPPGAAPG
jgi:hypothetical protein